MRGLYVVEPHAFDVSLSMLLTGARPERVYDYALVCGSRGCAGVRRLSMYVVETRPWDPGVALSAISGLLGVDVEVAELLAPVIVYDVVPVAPVVHVSRDMLVVNALSRLEHRLPPGCIAGVEGGPYTPGYVASRLRGACHGIERLLEYLDGVRRAVKPRVKRPSRATVLGVVGRRVDTRTLPRFVYAVPRGGRLVLVHSPSEAEAEKLASEFCAGLAHC